MTINIAVTGGKGGTGKTLVAVNLAVQLQRDGNNVLLIDCDTENPNSNILLGKNLNDKDVKKESVNIFKPEFDPELCTKCGDCRDACYRHAILQFADQIPSLMEHMCSGCETCMRICPSNAIHPAERKIGFSYFIEDLFKSPDSLDLLIGELQEGEAVSVLIVERILERANELNVSSKNGDKYDFLVLDTAPGAHCDVEHSLESADIIVAVTEPTPFGEHDLKRIMELIQIIGRKAYVLLNRSTLTNYKDELLNLIEDYESELIGQMPLSDYIVEDYAKGIPFVLDERNFPAKTQFAEFYQKLHKKLEEDSK